MDSVFDSVLQEEFVKNLSLKNLLKNPNGLSKEMIDADLKTVRQHEHENKNENNNENISESVQLNYNKKLNKSVDENETEGPRPGQFLLHQL
jgi:hypothetical protein